MTAQGDRERLSVGIVTYNSGKIIGGTLQALLSSLPHDLDCEIVVLDNDSRDDTCAIVEAEAGRESRLRLIESRQNLGFGRGHNAILETVTSDWHVFCNPDIAVMPDTLAALVAAMREHPDVGIVCPRVHFEDGRLQPLNKRHPTVLDLALRRFAPAPLKKLFARRMLHYEMRDIGYDRACDVPFVSGAFMTGRTGVLKSVGGFDPRYFLYFEDADLTRKVQGAGWRTVYCPNALVLHSWQRDAHVSLRGLRLFAGSAWQYFNKWGWNFF